MLEEWALSMIACRTASTRQPEWPSPQLSAACVVGAKVGEADHCARARRAAVHHESGMPPGDPAPRRVGGTVNGLTVDRHDQTGHGIGKLAALAGDGVSPVPSPYCRTGPLGYDRHARAAETEDLPATIGVNFERVAHGARASTSQRTPAPSLGAALRNVLSTVTANAGSFFVYGLATEKVFSAGSGLSTAT